MTQKQRVEIAQNELNSLLRSKAASLRQVILIDDARFTLIHVAQTHYSKLYLNLLLEKFTHWESLSDKTAIRKEQEKYFDLINQINSEQKLIIDFLVTHRDHYDCLYVEGLSYPGTYKRKNPLKDIENTQNEVQEALSFSNGHFKAPEPAYFAGASLFLYQQHEIPVLGVEHQGLLRLTHQLYNKAPLPKVSQNDFIIACHDERETQMLKNMSKNYEANNRYDHSLKFLLCGSLHDFENNISEWNKTHPKMKYNLFVLEL
ncbi:hypothetical protein PQO01_01885 [Lentisphaera marina]|uniref:hypothetical protein n=1 Tax=Lentisphaera marina TaxID=1111041 RepID=UPI0023653DE2|nr:hypothetical protein [Lentisphaera marina]MDD7983699.1 hypothetical protein [Lentisphaera marina]